MSQQKIIADRFKIEEVIGRGGMGEVYRAVDQQTEQLVAVKRLKPELVRDDPNFVKRFTQEGEALRQLDHPNIVSMISAFAVGDEHYLVMEYVSGGSLADLLQQKKRLSIRRSLEIALDLADALTRAHRLNIIHRDLKPSNVLLAEDGTPRLTDFGTARVQKNTQLTGTGIVLGTYSYMSPEACNGDLLDARTDIWSFGVMLYEMLTGQLPFDHPQLMHLLMAIMTEPPPDIQKLRPEVGDDLADLLYRMLAKNPDQRIPSIRLVGVELEVILQAENPDNRQVTPGRLRAPARFATTTYMRAGPPRHNLPVIATPFIGREVELAEITRLLADPDCRLLTLHGPGGIGKTRLAIEAGLQHLSQFQHGVYFVDLAVIEDDELVIPAIANAIRFSFFGNSEPEAQLLNYLQNKEMLLILDNFEQLMEKADFLFKILHTAPDIHMLVTSRGRLNLREEWLLPVSGLPLPAEVQGNEVTSATAVDFFLQSARRIRPNFSPDEKDLHAIHAICRLVDGLPLGIELAASWMNSLTPAEIAAEISGDFDFLTTSLRDLPVRHRSVRSVFEYSWQLLKEKEKQVLGRLSVFRGGFDRRAAFTVAEAALPVLNALIDKSLLRRSPTTGRYSLQELLRQFVVEKLAESPPAEAAARERHADYYLHYLQERLPHLKGGQQSKALSEIDRAIGNIRAAWQWALAQGNEAALALGLDALYHFYTLRGRQREGADMFAQAVQALRPLSGNQNLILMQLLARQGACSRFIGRLEEAKALLEESLRIARELGNKWEIAFSLYHLGAVDPGDSAAQAYWEESLRLAQEIGDQPLIAEALNWLAFAFYRKGDFTTAVHSLEKSLAIRRALEDQQGLATSLTNLGVIRAYLGEYDGAQELLQEGLQIYKRLRDLHGVAAACNNLCYIAMRNQDYAAAEHWGEQALMHFREVGDKKAEGEALGNLSEAAFYRQDYERAQTICQKAIKLYRGIGLSVSSFHNDLGRIALAQENYSEARQEFQQALQEEPNLSLTLDILTGIAAVMAATGEVKQAVALLTFIEQHPVSEQHIKERANLRITQLEVQLPSEQFTAAQTDGNHGILDEWLEAVKNL